MVSLYFKQGTSDKVYILDIVSKDNGWVVNFLYGRRGSTLASGTKTKEAVDWATAKKIYDKVLKEKLSEGYLESGDQKNYTVTPNEDRFTGVLPMLLNRIPDGQLYKYFTDPEWIEEQKHNGKRVMIRGTDGVIEGINRKGLLIGIPEIIVKELSQFPGSWLLDGEMVGERYKVFDRIDSEHWLITRKASLSYMMEQRDHPHIDVTPFYTGETEKSEFFEIARKYNMEGVVFKNLHSMYKPGRPNSGGDAMKFKFLADITCMVTHENLDRRSVMVSILDEHEEYRFIGNVTIPPNYDIPQWGTLIDVQYLYATAGGILYQPVYKGPRLDHNVDHFSDLKFQAEETEE